MRFDDMLATVLARDPERSGGRIALWRQIVDLLAQRRGGDAELTGSALARIEALRAEVPVAVRREAAAAIAGRPLPRGVVALLASDVPPVAGAVLAHALLDEADWIALLPSLSPTGRGFLRHRRDLGPKVAAALAGFGTSDFAVTGPMAPASLADAEPTRPGEPAATFDPDSGEGQIRSIISRIASFRTAREETPPAAPPPAEMFQFETGFDGTIRWVEGVPRGPLIGETIARPATGAYGVDAQAPGAFRRRAPFRDARLEVAGEGPAAGAWRLSGVPVFASADGRFMGYRGIARRPRVNERAEPAATAPAANADTLRQLVHELRTPINAIGGFAEMIRRQMRGPVAEAYRVRADAIAGEAGRLLTAVDDLDVSARLDGARLDLQRGAIDVAALLAPTCAEQAEAAAARDVAIDWTLPGDLPAAYGDGAIVRRMAARLVGAAAAIADAGEGVSLVAGYDASALSIEVSRPRRLAGVPEAALFDPGYDAEGAWPDAPLLGLGFSLHLVRRLAVACGAELRVTADRFVLRLLLAEPTGETLLG